MIHGWGAFASANLLTANEKAIFDNLQGGKIRTSIEGLIQNSSVCNTMPLARKVLRILSQTTDSPARERFLAALLDGSDISLLATLEKVYLISKKGFFANLVENDKLNSRRCISQKKLIEFIDQFDRETVPLLIENSNDRSMLRTSSVSEARYNQLQRHQNYNDFSKEIAQFLVPEKKKLQELFIDAFNSLDLQYVGQFTNKERLLLIRAILRILHPAVKQHASSYSMLDTHELMREAAKLKNEVGEEGLTLFFNSLEKSNEYRLDEIIRGMYLLNAVSGNSEFFSLLHQWREKKCLWSELFLLIENFQMNQKPPPAFLLEDISARLQRFRTDRTVATPLSEERILKIGDQFEEIKTLCASRLQCSFIQLMQEAHAIRQKAMVHPISEEERLMLLSIVCLAIRIHFEIDLNSTQILSLLALFSGSEKEQAQIKTGEGKSFIIMSWSFIKAMECKSIDIITSARYLAIRDQRKGASFLNRADITTSHICYDNHEPSHFKAQILYGPTFDFEFAWMKDRLFGTALYEARLTAPYVKRNFDCVGVDESDNLLIDAMHSGARLAFPAETSFDFVYSPLLCFIHWVCTEKDDEFSQEENYLIRFRQYINDPSNGLNFQDLEQSENGFAKYLSTLLRNAEIGIIIPLTVSRARKHLIDHSNSDYHERIQQIDDQKICQWLFSAHRAQFLLNNTVDYVVNRIRSEEGLLQQTIQIVDLRTGRISQNSRWQGGIHEFLEVKHGIPVAKESLNPISLSHAVFYGFYSTITALTGTSEKKQTKRIYQIETFDIPSHLPLQRIDHPVEMLRDEESYFARILQEIDEIVKAGRPLLILCPTIMDTQELAKRVKKNGVKHQLLNEIQEELEHHIIEKAGEEGMVTIATNTAGRGTDIILNQASLNNGGLHVMMIFDAEDERDKIQGLGRAGRQGQKGSSRIVLHRNRPEIVKALENQILGRVTDGQLINLLTTYRDSEEKKRSKQNCERAELDRLIATITHPFYDTFQRWSALIDSEEFISLHSEKLNTIKLKNPNKQFIFNHLRVNDRTIALQCVKLFKAKDTLPMSWKVLLKSAVQRMKEKTIEAWCLNFHHKIEHLMAEEDTSKKKQYEVAQLYDDNEDSWIRYMASNGAGLYTYFEDLTGIKIIR